MTTQGELNSEMDSRKRVAPRMLVAVIASLLVIAACSAGDDAETVAASTDSAVFGVADAVDDAMDFDEEEMAEEVEAIDSGAVVTGGEAAAQPVASQTAGQANLGSNAVQVAETTAADLGRKIIFTAVITVEVESVAASAAEATQIVTDLGGFVFGEQSQGGASPSSTLTFKVLPEDFDDAVAALGGVGDIRNQSISADDVTERIVDLETRIGVAELGVERLRETLTETRDLEDYAEIERLLLDRESTLEVMRAQIRNLQNQVDLATIVLTLVQDQVNHLMTLGVTYYEAHDGGASCPGDGSSRVATGADVTMCFEIINIGDEPVIDIAFIDPALGISSIDEMIPVFGSPDRLDGGQSLIVAHEFTPDRNQRSRAKATARPIDAAGVVVGPSIDAAANSEVSTFEQATDPGFADGLSAGWDVVAGVWTALKVVTGFLLPLVVLLPFLAAGWFALRALRRRRSARAPRTPQAGPTGRAHGAADAEPGRPPAPNPAAAFVAGTTTGASSGPSGPDSPSTSTPAPPPPHTTTDRPTSGPASDAAPPPNL